MSECKMNRQAYVKCVEDNINFLKEHLPEELFNCLWTSHIITIMKESVNLMYGPNYLKQPKALNAKDVEEITDIFDQLVDEDFGNSDNITTEKQTQLIYEETARRFNNGRNKV